MYYACCYGESGCSICLGELWQEVSGVADIYLKPDTHLVEGVRTGVRASGIGERPYLDLASTGRREALGLPRF